MQELVQRELPPLQALYLAHHLKPPLLRHLPERAGPKPPLVLPVLPQQLQEALQKLCWPPPSLEPRLEPPRPMRCWQLFERLLASELVLALLLWLVSALKQEPLLAQRQMLKRPQRWPQAPHRSDRTLRHFVQLALPLPLAERLLPDCQSVEARRLVARALVALRGWREAPLHRGMLDRASPRHEWPPIVRSLWERSVPHCPTPSGPVCAAGYQSPLALPTCPRAPLAESTLHQRPQPFPNWQIEQFADHRARFARLAEKSRDWQRLPAALW